LKEFQSRDKYDVDKSELVKKLALDEDLVYILYHLRIRTVEDLASCSVETLSRRVDAYLLNTDADSQAGEKNKDRGQANSQISRGPGKQNGGGDLNQVEEPNKGGGKANSQSNGKP
jgi:hypothetical protein